MLRARARSSRRGAARGAQAGARPAAHAFSRRWHRVLGSYEGDRRAIAEAWVPTAETLARNSRPVRIIRIATLDEKVMGALLMHFMIETIISANLVGVDPFDQPAVEEGKVLTRDYLRQFGSQT